MARSRVEAEMFYYATGEQVEVGDIVEYEFADGWRRYVVVSIFAAFTQEAENF
jgi:hypothetical protein